MPDVLDKALAKHHIIKQKMKKAIRDTSSGDPDELRDDQNCIFGLWINGAQGTVHRGRPEYEAMKISHRRFHEAAYTAACLCRTGNKEAAERSILTGEFEQSGADFRQRLVTLRNAIR